MDEILRKVKTFLTKLLRYGGKLRRKNPNSANPTNSFKNRLKRINDKKWTKASTGWCIIGLLIIASGIILDYNYTNLSDKTRIVLMVLISSQDSVADLYSLLSALCSISAAAVILFYSVMDNRKEGIPHRRVMAFSYGCYSVPILFILSILLMFAGYIIGKFYKYCLCFSIWIYVFILQIVIIRRVLFVTSYEFCVKKITKMEKCQLTEFVKHEDEVKKAGRSLDSYFIHYLDIVMSSGEITYEKIDLTRKILKMPFELLKEGEYVSESQLYHFYQENLRIVFTHLKDESISSIYNYLFELFTDRKEDFNECKAYIFSLVSAVWNSVLVNTLEGAETLCIELLNELIANGKPEKDQDNNAYITFYFLSLEYAFRRTGILQQQHFERIRGFYNWKFDASRDINMCEKFWNIWMEYIPLNGNSHMYLLDALDTFSGQKTKSLQISYILSYIRGRNDR